MKKPIETPPPVVGGGHLLYYAVLDKSIRYSGKALIFVGKIGDMKELKKVPCVAIVKYVQCSNGEKEMGLMYCDKQWQSMGYAPSESIEAAMHKAERRYPGISSLWVDAKVTKKQVRDYERQEEKEWRAMEKDMERITKNAPSQEIAWKRIKRKYKKHCI